MGPEGECPLISQESWKRISCFSGIELLLARRSLRNGNNNLALGPPGLDITQGFWRLRKGIHLVHDRTDGASVAQLGDLPQSALRRASLRRRVDPGVS